MEISGQRSVKFNKEWLGHRSEAQAVRALVRSGQTAESLVSSGVGITFVDSLTAIAAQAAGGRRGQDFPYRLFGTGTMRLRNKRFGSASSFSKILRKSKLVSITRVDEVDEVDEIEGRGKARELILLANEVDGAEAFRMGLANACTEPGQALEVALVTAQQLALAGRTLPVEGLKTRIKHSAVKLEAALSTERQAELVKH